MTGRIKNICGAEPNRENEYPWAYSVGSDGVTSIVEEQENLGTYGITWFLAKCGDKTIAKMNALHVAHVAYLPEGADALIAAEGKRPEVFEMRLCETDNVVLKPDTTYRFTVDPHCPRCVNLSARAKGGAA